LKLKELHIFGFKSFADKTSLQFGQDITIVVGPNGSGKSNIFDAIRWVLGEQSAKQLRGGKMEDVIFIGSDSRKTLGMAEVSIVMDNTDRSINLNYNEVKVTRRLYRSGESEYYINDQPVRLKDIVETFMDTGVGLDSYSIISQGEVDKIINAKPIERREIFEEAAGITKYIKKRDEGLRKLEATEQNMLRINDILVEVKRQASVLERQAKKAEQYKVLKQECSDMEIKMLKKEIKDRTIKNREFNIKKAEIDGRIETEEAGLSKFESEFDGMKFKNLEMEKDIAEKREKWVIKQEEIKRLEDSLKFLAERHAELLQRIEASKNENLENVGKIEGIKVDIENKNKAIADKDGIIKDREAQLENLNKRHEIIISEYEFSKKDRDEKTFSAEKIGAEVAALKNRTVELELNIKNIEEQLGKLEVQKLDSDEKLKMTKIDMQSISENRLLKEEEIKGIKEKEENLLKEKMRRKISLSTVEETLKELGLVINRLESRRNFLQQMQSRMEGYGEIVRKVLTEYKVQLDDNSKKDLVDVVANLIAVEKPYERAVEKTLAGLLQTVLIRNEKLIEEIFTLYEMEKGEITFINSSNLRVDTTAVLDGWKKSVVHKNVVAYLPEQIEVDAGNEVVKLLFANIFVVENLEKAKAVLEDVKKETQYYLLTLNGELISNYNIFTKGEGLAGEGFLSREREIAEITTEIETAVEKHKAVEAERVFQADFITGMEKEIENLSVIYHSQYVEVIKDDERIKQKNEDLERHETSIRMIGQEIGKLNSEKDNYMTGKSALLLEEQRIVENLETAKKLIEEARLNIAKKEEDVNTDKNVIDDKKLEIVTLKNDYEFEINNKSMLETRLKEVETGYLNTVAEIEALNARVISSEEESRGNASKIENIKSTLVSDENSLADAKRLHDEFKTSMTATEENIKNMSKTRDKLKDEQYDIKIKINDMAVQIANFFEKLQLDFKLTPDENEVLTVEIAEEEYKELNVKVTEFREKIDKLGVINLVAIEEYNELKNRNEHLQLQYDDLVTARENLKKIIKKANEESKELFTKAFDAIRIKFGDVFKKMFNGGEADIVLSDQENILESGIDIIARPPGKKLQNISLLSGGEKAITAVSLLFALFLTKASPFCVMDEIDAPLDDVNVTRFTNLVKSFKATQFIIISHNKLTMEIGDVLYGVSMEKAGVSQIISVKMDKDRDKIKQILSKDGKSAALKESEKKAEELKEIAEADALGDTVKANENEEEPGDGKK
jgi:chromosome segregation protein